MTSEETDGRAAAAPALVRIAAIVVSKTNPRRSSDKTADADLLESVRKHGVLQPVLVRPGGGGVYELVAGARRLRAAVAAGLEAIPALVLEMSNHEALEAQVVENLQRSDLHPLEEAQGYQQLMREGYDVAKIAARVGRSPAYVYDRVKLLNLTKAAQKAFLAGEFTPGHAVILARLKPEDQDRAMGTSDALFTSERSLFVPDHDDYLQSSRFEDEPRKPVSVRELQAWVDEHTKLEADQVEQMLFPETAETLRTAQAEDEKVVRITYEEMTPLEARDGPKVILGRSWKRADGQHGSKQCDRSVIGMIVIGPGRGQALRVCVDKKRCTVHWGDLIKAAKKREKAVQKGASTGEDREALRRQKDAEEASRRKAEEERWDKARPAMLDALAAAVKKAPAGPGGVLGKAVLRQFGEVVWLNPADKKLAAAVTPGKTAEDLVRHLAFTMLVDESNRSFNEGPEFSATAKSLGVDVAKILDQVAPAAKAAPKPKTAKRAKGKAA